jgi:hypothetical protein
MAIRRFLKLFVPFSGKGIQAKEPIFAEIDMLRSRPFSQLRQMRISAIESAPYLTDYPAPPPPLKRDLAPELYSHRRAMIGASQLEFLHVCLIVMLRRRIETRKNFTTFHRIWNEEKTFLLKTLNSRWLVSACDTFADHARDKADRTTALAGAILLNTIKIYETERIFRGDYKEKEFAPHQWLHLFDGMHSFWIGNGDVIFNLKRRIDRLRHEKGPVDAILVELFERVNVHNTAFGRFRSVHTLLETKW